MFRKWDVTRKKIRKNGCTLKQLKEKKDKYIVQKKTRKIKVNLIFSGAIKQLSQRASFSGGSIFRSILFQS